MEIETWIGFELGISFSPSLPSSSAAVSYSGPEMSEIEKTTRILLYEGNYKLGNELETA